MTVHTPSFDTIFTAGTIVDGSGAPPYQADVGIRQGRISAIGDLSQALSTERIDCQGCMITPGFIDSHTHDDGYLLTHPDMVPKVSQGITTVVTGNCGISLAPVITATPPQPLDLLGPAELFRFGSFSAWLNELKAQPAAVNVIPLLGHTSLRVAFMQDLQRTATAQEITAMQGGVDEALASGAFGLSSGLFYPPAAAATTSELLEVVQPMAALGTTIYATHLRDEADFILPAIDEALEIGAAARSTIVFSHHKLAGEHNHGRSRQTLARIDQASALQNVCLDCHPYPATSTMLRLDRVRLASRTIVTWSTAHPQYAGKDFAALEQELGMSDEELLAYLSPAGAIYFLMHDQDIKRIFAHPLTMVGSDGLPFDPHPHPRQWGTFTRVLRTMVREQSLLNWQQAIHKMTGLPARQYRLHERGLIQENYHADLVIFNPDTVTDLATFEQPVQSSRGIQSVWVAGEQVWDGQHATGKRPGQVLTPEHLRAS